jgi:hypothetical protein
MTKGYPISPPLQIKLAAQSSVSHRHNQVNNCGEIAAEIPACTEFVHPMLTMNSMVRQLFPD